MSDTLLAFINRKNWLKKQSQKWAHNYTYGKSRLPTPVFLDFPWSSAGKESTCNVGDLGLIPGLGRSPGEGKGYPLQYYGLENSMGCTSPWGRNESDTTEPLSLSLSWQSWFQLVLPPAQCSSWCTLHRSQVSWVTIYSLDGLLFLFGTSLLWIIFKPSFSE